MSGKVLSPARVRELLETLKVRFEKNSSRHPGVDWQNVRSGLEKNPDKLWSLSEMENTDGEPDIISTDKQSGELIFYDCSPESPLGRRNLCYDREGQQSRKGGGHPAGNVIDIANAMGIELLTEEQYRKLQTLGEFDTKTQSWLKTPDPVRKLGGAIFADRRYGRVFIYHNTAPCFYSGRAFRGSLKI